jgi:hypothetical protein
MRSPFLAILLALQFSSSAMLAQSRPIPPGIRKADQVEVQSERDTPSPTPRRTFDLEKVKHDADELSALAQSIPPGVDQTARGPALGREAQEDQETRQTAQPAFPLGIN